MSKYVASLYFVYSTVTTVGYGDIAATTVYERYPARPGPARSGPR